jgi:hypothetical protein
MLVLHSTWDVWNGSLSEVIEVEHRVRPEEVANFCLMIQMLTSLKGVSSDPVYH